jgi:hypothetical protein
MRGPPKGVYRDTLCLVSMGYQRSNVDLCTSHFTTTKLSAFR